MCVEGGGAGGGSTCPLTSCECALSDLRGGGEDGRLTRETQCDHLRTQRTASNVMPPEKQILFFFFFFYTVFKRCVPQKKHFSFLLLAADKILFA